MIVKITRVAGIQVFQVFRSFEIFQAVKSELGKTRIDGDNIELSVFGLNFN